MESSAAGTKGITEHYPGHQILVRARSHELTLPGSLNFHSINARAQQFATFLRAIFDDYVCVLLEYETFEVAKDELNRSTDLFENLSENEMYFKKKVGVVATFLPRNQPLYALSCFALIPSLMSEEVHVWVPRIMHSFFFRLIEKLRINDFFPNVLIFRKLRSEFLDQRCKITLNSLTNEYEPVTNVVIFTGTQINADKIRSIFSSRTLFIANGSGHNPVIVSENADVVSAVESVLRLKLYNQGQDCAAPNSILVHRLIYDDFLCLIRTKLKITKIGPYCDRGTQIGPISDRRDLKRIQSILVDNFEWLDVSTPGIIRTGQSIVEPTIILKPLTEGGNFDEHFAPLLFIQKYDDDTELRIYFEDLKYAPNAMYVTVFGSSDYVNKELMDLRLKDERPLHTTATIIRDSDLHAPGVERGIRPYGGYGRGASSLSIYGNIISQPTLVQRDIFEQLVLPTIQSNVTNHPKLNETANIDQYIRKTRSISVFIPDSNISVLATESSYFDLARQLIVRYKTRENWACLIQIIPSCELQATKLREIMISFRITRELLLLGVSCSLIIVWCDMEALENEYWINGTNYVGQPIHEVPDIFNQSSSLSDRFLHDFRKIMLDFEIDYDLKIQSIMYAQGMYDSYMFQFLLEQDTYDFQKCPFKVYSKFTRSHDTQILAYAKNRIIYKCSHTSEIDTTDINNHETVVFNRFFNVLVLWKIFDVQFVPSCSEFFQSYNRYSSITKAVTTQCDISLPGFIEVKPISVVNDDNSVIKDIPVRKLLAIYPIAILKYIYMHTEPNSILPIYFDKRISRHYDAFDAVFYQNTPNQFAGNGLSFHRLLSLGEIGLWNAQRLRDFFREFPSMSDTHSLNERIRCMRFWQQTYNTDSPKGLLKKPNLQYWKHLCESRRQWIHQLKRTILGEEFKSIKQLETEMRTLQKYPNISFKTHCMDTYNLLLGEDTGPRLTTLLWIANRESVISLLAMENEDNCSKI